MDIKKDGFLKQQEYLKAWFNLNKFVINSLIDFPFIPLGFNISFSIKDCPDRVGQSSHSGCLTKEHGVLVYANSGSDVGNTLIICFREWLLEKIDSQYQIDLFDTIPVITGDQSHKEYLNNLFKDIAFEINEVYSV